MEGAGGLGRYRLLAAGYDVLSGERPLYRVGRLAGTTALAPAPGDRVLVLGCGTGMDLPLLCPAVGPRGRVVGVDASPAMLRRAARRVERNRWEGVRLLRADATTVAPADLRAALGEPGAPAAADAVLFTYSLSLMRPWRAAWATALACARPGARVVLVDLGLPHGWARPLARAACALGGSDVRARPWTAVRADLVDVSAREFRGGHVQVHAGRVPEG
ncbi:class I SAM-dependent methyltransferase [Kineococcus sp. SYSU DK004]|uniref:class I SAM-dependent methyltransferase n=1 Tax=Kineococcus sp. SYSU DK004 TaxID=3383125 RepID=UPI003D7E31F9